MIKEIDMQIFAVGKKVGKEVILPETIGAKFDFYKGTGQLIVCVDNPSGIEINTFKTGNVGMGMIELLDVLFLTWKFYIGHGSDRKDVMDFETPYNIHLGIGMVDREFVVPDEGEGYGIQIILVDSSTRIVKGIRVIGAPNEWSNDFRKICDKQRYAKFDPNEYNKDIDAVCESFTTQQLVSISKPYTIELYRLPEREEWEQ